MLKKLALKLKAFREIIHHFENPWLTLMLRSGWLRLPVFPYRLKVRDQSFHMLARPSRATMSDLFVLREVFIQETYRDVLPLLSKRPLRIVDVGANLGSFTIWLHRRHGVAEAHCFEPEPTSFRLCRYNLAANDCPFAEVAPKAVGGQRRQLMMRVNTSRPGGNSIYASVGAGEDVREVEVVAFGEWLNTVPSSFDLLKLDCEGAEWEIATTLPEQAARFPVVVAEIHDDPAGKFRVDGFPRLMEKFGFKTVRWDGHAQGLYLGART